MKIFLNPSYNSNTEIDSIVGNIGHLVEGYLRAVGYNVKLLQYDSQEKTCFDANAWIANLVIRIDINKNASGTSAIYYSNSDNGKKLANCLLKQVTESLGTINNGLVSSNEEYICIHTNAPAVVINVANYKEDHTVLTEKTDDFARAIARGITDYFVVDKPNAIATKIPEEVKQTYSADMFSEHFAKSEFVCHCCGRGANLIDPKLVELLEQLRSISGTSIHLNCAYRCPQHNIDVGGVSNSQHVYGTAADITMPDISFEKAHDLVASLDFDGTGFYPPLESGGAWFIHVDTRDGGIGSHIEWWE